MKVKTFLKNSKIFLISLAKYNFAVFQYNYLSLKLNVNGFNENHTSKFYSQSKNAPSHIMGFKICITFHPLCVSHLLSPKFADKVHEAITRKEAELDKMNYEKIFSGLTSEIILLTSHHDSDTGFIYYNF